MLTHYSNYGHGLSDSELYESAINVLQQATFGLTDSYERSLDYIVSQLGVPPAFTIPRLNETPARPVVQELSLGHYDEIVARNLADKMLYEKAKELFELRYEEFALHRFIREHGVRALPQFGLADQDGVYHWNVSDRLIGRSWHNLETDDQGRCTRWSGPSTQASIWLGVPAACERAKVVVCITRFAHQRIADRLTIEVNGRSKPIHSGWSANQGMIYGFELGQAELESGILGLHFDSGFAVRGRDVSETATDLRYVGVGLHEITFTPLT